MRRPGRRQTLLESVQRRDTSDFKINTYKCLSWFLTSSHSEDSAHHACVVVLCGLCLVLLHHTGEAACIGGGAGEVLTLRDGWGPANEIRTTPWVNHSPAQPSLISSHRTQLYNTLPQLWNGQRSHKHTYDQYCLLYTPVLGGCEHLRRALIGRVVRFGILRDVTAVRGLLGIRGVLSTAT